MSGVEPTNQGRSGWDVFNPFSEKFKEAEKIFHEDFSQSKWHWKQAVVVIASMIGGLFLIVGAFPLFCWTVKVLKPGDDQKVDSTARAAHSLFPTQNNNTPLVQQDRTNHQKVLQAEKVQTVQQDRATLPQVYCVKGSLWQEARFNKFLATLRTQGLNCIPITHDPGPNQHVIFFHFCGSLSRGSVETMRKDQHQFGKEPQAKLHHVVIVSNPVGTIQGIDEDFDIIFRGYNKQNLYNEFVTNLKKLFQDDSSS